MCERVWLSAPPAAGALHCPAPQRPPRHPHPHGHMASRALSAPSAPLCSRGTAGHLSPALPATPITPQTPLTHTVCRTLHVHPQPQNLDQGSEQVTRAKSHHPHTPPSRRTPPSRLNGIFPKFTRHCPSPQHNIEAIQVKHVPSVGPHPVGLGSYKRRTRGHRLHRGMTT